MVCVECAQAADYNRAVFEYAGRRVNNMMEKHPEKCECTCMHREMESWDKFFSMENPHAQEN